MGWGTILYLAALTQIDENLYEAARIDGANRWRQTLHVTLPGILPTIITLLILNIGTFLAVGFEKILLLYTPSTYETADVISTYLYRVGGQQQLLLRHGDRTLRVGHRADVGAQRHLVSVKSSARAFGEGDQIMKESTSYKAFKVFNVTFLLVVVFVTLYPFVNIIAQSFSSQDAIAAGKVNLFPVGFNTVTYAAVAGDAMFWRNYGNTVLYTVVATAISMVLTTCYAYVLSKKHIKGRGLLIGVAVFTMFFNGGLIPNYILISSLGMKNTIWAVVLPNAISVFNLLVMKVLLRGDAPGTGGGGVHRRPQPDPDVHQDRAAAVQGRDRHDGAVLRGQQLERLVRGLPLHGQAGTVPRDDLPAEPDRRHQRRPRRRGERRQPDPGRRQHQGRDDGPHGSAHPHHLPVRPDFVSGVMLGSVKG